VSTTDPEIHFRENVVATFNLLEAMRRRGVKELVFASSSSVYGEPESIPVDEDTPIRPVSVYEHQKQPAKALSMPTRSSTESGQSCWDTQT